MKKLFRLPTQFLFSIALAISGCGGGGGGGGGGTPLSSAKAITAYSLAGVTGTIDEINKTIAVTLPTGTKVTALVATFTTTGAKVDMNCNSIVTCTGTQVSGVTANDFTIPLVYIVTAADGSTVNYTATVTVPPAPVYAGPFYVDTATGLDTNNGAAATPFKTISKALAAAQAVGTANTINVAAGTYGTGETMPLTMVNNVKLIGAGSATTTISGWGFYNLAGVMYQPALVFPPATTATVTGFTITGGLDTNVIVDGATSATLTNSFSNGVTPPFSSDGMYIAGAANVTLTGNTISGNCWFKGALTIWGTPKVTARNNTISDACLAAVTVTGGGTAATSPTVDLGTAASPGGNTINGGTTSVGINISGTAIMVNASGNTWHLNKQGASATGAYTAGTTGTNPTAVLGGNNYAIGTSTGLQF